ncbi:MAG: tetratricopeptide repeat protein [Gammaproteobacteria bacterium]
MRRTWSGLVSVMRCALAICASVALCSVASAKDKNARTVKDLEYGHALFHFYQEDYFESAARLLAAQTQNRVSHHTDDADLLLGGIYLSYGQQQQANDIFARLLDDNVKPEVRDRAWLYAAQIAYQRGRPDNAMAALNRIGRKLEPEFEARKRLLNAQILIESDQFELAAEQLTRWRPPAGWRSYVRYNLGVAMIRNGDTRRGTKLLSQAASGAPTEQTGRTWLRPWRWFRRSKAEEYDEGSALRDKVFLALGFAHLKEGESEEALKLLDKVGGGMWATKASLGQGWAAVEMGEYQRALASWETLTGGDPLDPAVQESRLGIPFAYAKLGDENRALQGYRDAIAVFGDEVQRLESLSERLVGEKFLDGLLQLESGAEVGWFWSLDEVPNDERGRYLFALMADHEFQEGLKNYRDLTALRQNLLRWERGIEAFDVMLETRRARYAAQERSLADNDSTSRLAGVSQRVNRMAKELTRVARERDTLALATPEEARSLERVASVERTLGKVAGDPKYALQRDKLALLKGTLLWRLNDEYAARLWESKKTLKVLNAQLTRARDRSLDVGIAQLDAPKDFDEFEARVERARPRVAALQARVEGSMLAHENYLKGIALDRFDQHANRLRAYLTEAQFALASTYDRLSYVEVEE